MEKNRFGVFLHDVTRIYSEITVLSLPALFTIALYPVTTFVDVTAMGLVAWMTMVLTGTLIRGGTVAPFATTSPGWVTLAPTLLVLRLVYFNLGLLVAAFGGLALAAVAGTAAGLLWAGGFAAILMLYFPRSAELWLARGW
jgi:nitrate reductase NapE component